MSGASRTSITPYLPPTSGGQYLRPERLLAAFDRAAAMRGRTHLRMAPEPHLAAAMNVGGKRTFGADLRIAAAVNLNRNGIGGQRANICIAAAVHGKRQVWLFRKAGLRP